mgnify:CR=1 FL=1
METFDCDICLYNLPLTLSFNAFYCDHKYCQECLQNFFNFSISEKSIGNLHCPSCLSPPNFENVKGEKGFLSEALLEELSRLLLNFALDKIPDLYYCPRCNIPSLADNQGYTYVHCSNQECNFCFCRDCFQMWHNGPCFETEDETETEAEGQSSKRNPLKRLNHDPSLYDRALILNTTKKCPYCKVLIEKNGGCSHMFCIKCRNHFSWSDIQFELPSSAMRRVIGKMNNSKVISKIKKPRTPKDPNSIPCPGCGHSQSKISSSNHLTCSNCRARFCFQCRSLVKGTLHFSPPNKCKQHSPLPDLTQSVKELSLKS